MPNLHDKVGEQNNQRVAQGSDTAPRQAYTHTHTTRLHHPWASMRRRNCKIASPDGKIVRTGGGMGREKKGS